MSPRPLNVVLTVVALTTSLSAQISHWALDGDLLDSEGINDGIWFGGAEPLFVAGYDGTPAGAVFFDGIDDRVQIPDDALAPTLALTDNFTLALWFRAASNDQVQKYLLSRNGGGGQYAIIYEFVEDQVEFFAGSFSGDDPRPGTTMAITDTGWHHIAYTYDGFTLAGYLDGGEQFSSEISFVLSDGFFAPWWIGAANAGANHVRGVIDDVRIYGEGLDSDAIAELYSEPVTAECPVDGDTHATALDVTGPGGNVVGTYTATAGATDDSGDTPLYTFTASEEGGATITIGPQTGATAEFSLVAGVWTVSVEVDDDPLCPDIAGDATLSADPIEVVSLPALIGHWEFDGDLSDSAGSNDGVFNGAAGAPVFVDGVGGTPEGAIFFNGIDEFVQTPRSLELALGDQFTLALWFRSESVDQSQTYLLSRNDSFGGGSGEQYAIIYEYTNDRVDFYAPSRAFGDDPRVGAMSEMPLADTEWHHIAYTYDGTDWSGYMDGVQLFTVPLSFALDATFESSWFIGAANPIANWVWGAFDDVRIYNYALTAEEVQDISGLEDTCPEEGDTHVTELEIDGPLDGEPGGPGTYEVVADAEDDSGDTVFYRFTASNGLGTVLSEGPQEADSALFVLTDGTWTITVAADDDPLCPDAAEDATREEVIEVTSPPALLGWWELEGDLIDSAGANDGVFFGGDDVEPVFVDGADGEPEGALSTDGVDDYVEIPAAPELALSTSFTLALWFRAASNDQSQKYLLSRNAPGAQYAIIYEYVDDQVEFFAGGSFDGDDPRPGSTMPVTDTEWHHVAYTYDGATLTGYIDGIVIVSNPLAFSLRYFDSSWYIGAANPGANWVAGALDDVRIYNYALTEAEIEEIAGGEVPAVTFRRGDADAVAEINLTDGVFLLNFLFLGGGEPPCMDAADANDDGRLDITTAVYIFNWLFLGGPVPPAPGAEACGSDPSGDELDCAAYENCP